MKLLTLSTVLMLAASTVAQAASPNDDSASAPSQLSASEWHSIERREESHSHSDHHDGKENKSHPDDVHHKTDDKKKGDDETHKKKDDKQQGDDDSSDDGNNNSKEPWSRFRRKNIRSFSLRAWGPWEETIKGDVIFVDLQFAPKSLAKRLKNMGKEVVCYISVGTVENFRHDRTDFARKELAKKYKGFDGEETWLDITHWEDFKGVMTERIRRAKKAGCTAMEYDNVDCFLNKCVKGASYEFLKDKQIEYIHWLLKEAHKYDLRAGLKNAMPIIKHFYDDMDFGINEECMQYNECGPYEMFADAGKVIFSVEYSPKDNVCEEARRRKFLTKYEKGGKWRNCFDY